MERPAEKRDIRYDCVLFDLDGTLTDSGPGITGGGAYAFEKLGLPVPPCEDLRTMVGPPLSSSFPRLGVPADRVEEAIGLYRHYYNRLGGKFENSVYPGVREMLERLKERGLRLFVATAKPEPVAREVLAHFGLDRYFDYIAGAGSDFSRESKADVLKYLLETAGDPEGTILVGDTVYDVAGANELGIPCVGVTWGYGSVKDMEAAGAAAIVSSPEELFWYLEGKKDPVMKMHIIQQNDWVGPGGFLTWAERRGCRVTVTKVFDYQPLPETADADILVVLGGWQNPGTTLEECDYFDAKAQEELIRRYAAAGKIVVGSCLGLQLMGDAFGGSFSHSPEREVGPMELRLTPAGRKDPVLAAFPDVFLAGEWHSDMAGLTEECEVLAESDGCPRQLIRYGDLAYGFQAHLEFTREILAEGLRRAGHKLKDGGRYVLTPEEILAFDYTKTTELLCSLMDALVDRYLRK